MGLTSATVQAASRGMDVSSAAAYVPNDRAPLVKNLLPGRTGRLPVRGGAHTYSGSAQVTGSALVAPWTFDNKVLLPYTGAISSPQQQGTVVELSNTGFIYTQIANSSGVVLRQPHASYARLGNYVFGVGTDSSLFGGANSILRWDGRVVTNDTLIGYANAPTATLGSARAVAAHLNRLFVLTDPGGTTLPTLYWSIDGGPVTDTAAAWQDPASGLTNQIQLEYNGEQPRALAHVGRNLLILKSESLWMLTGDSPDSFALRRVSSIGCAATSAVCEYNDGVFFAGNHGGVWFFDGATTTRVSTPIEGYDPGVVGTSGPSFKWITKLDEESLFLTTASNPTAVGSSDRAYIYHVPTGSWSQFTSAAMVALPSWVGRTTDYAFAVSTTNPGTGFVQATVWDISKVGHPNDSANPTSTPGYDSIVNTGSLIPARLTSRLLKLGSPELKAQLNRFLADYDLSTNGSPPTSGLAWNVTAKDDLGTTLFTTALPAVANPGRQRFAVDQFAEVSKALQFDITLGQTGGGVQTISTAELEDLSVVYQVTRP